MRETMRFLIGFFIDRQTAKGTVTFTPFSLSLFLSLLPLCPPQAWQGLDRAEMLAAVEEAKRVGVRSDDVILCEHLTAGQEKSFLQKVLLAAEP